MQTMRKIQNKYRLSWISSTFTLEQDGQPINLQLPMGTFPSGKPMTLVISPRKLEAELEIETETEVGDDDLVQIVIVGKETENVHTSKNTIAQDFLMQTMRKIQNKYRLS